MKNRFEIRGEVTAIFLSHKGRILETLIDTVDLPKAQAYPNTWFAQYHPDVDNYYVVGRAIRNGVSNRIKLHRVIMETPSDMVVDHFNHNTLDNRRSINLRNVTSDQNHQNRLRRNGFRGVSWHKQLEKWVVALVVNGERRSFGSYDKYEDAVKVAKRALSTHVPFSLEANEQLPKVDVKRREKAKRVSGIRGITWHEYSQKWRVRVRENGKNVLVSSFADLEEAIKNLNDYKKPS